MVAWFYSVTIVNFCSLSEFEGFCQNKCKKLNVINGKSKGLTWMGVTFTKLWRLEHNRLLKHKKKVCFMQLKELQNENCFSFIVLAYIPFLKKNENRFMTTPCCLCLRVSAFKSILRLSLLDNG
jgi:hypothetical protein